LKSVVVQLKTFSKNIVTGKDEQSLYTTSLQIEAI
jgi:hypothetical protein